MFSRKTFYSVFNIFTILLLILITISGLSSFGQAAPYDFINLYGDRVEIWGGGIYGHDSYFKAPIFIGSDFTILVVVVPWLLLTFYRTLKNPSLENYISNFGIYSLLLYYSASLAFGVTYNILHLAYIALFSLSFFAELMLLKIFHGFSLRLGKFSKSYFSKAMKVFLFVAGLSLFLAWLPDIIISIFKGRSLGLIEVYTTEITNVLDMGIISPLMFFTYYLIKNEDFLGYVFLRMLFKVCLCIGIMLPIQTIFQVLAGISIPLAAVISKILTFVLMAFFAAYFEWTLKRQSKWKNIVVER
ncbi:MAG: hypothetical protein Q4E36_04820 [Bacillota bacterium]|nr:hypothetical protein [Bacillota bacterium]